ncbi:MAG: hypothetical protein B0D92_01660 [Spirochaeta sp. LUC14_002_19_P3]|nr:MAG: hypothetical protein B0D92_01660 [Spirochaeta sp. LUC14_002_19_P3]
MKNAVQRIILFAIAIPGFTFLILLVPHYHYLWLTLLLVLVGIQSGIELRAMMANIAPSLPLWTIFIPGAAPVLSWLAIAGLIDVSLTVLCLTCGLIWAFGGLAFLPENSFSSGVQRLASRLMIIIYPGYFIWWIHAISGLPDARTALFVFMLTIFLNDSAAWLFGMLFGRHRGLFAVSPNKSIEGFIAGVLTSTLIIMASSWFFPALLPHPNWQLLLGGTVLGISIPIGDLTESALKRAVGVKDSGHIMPGRGGMLDSIDSILFAAPLYVIFIRLGGYSLA